jgi:hypothetical protein
MWICRSGGAWVTRPGAGQGWSDVGRDATVRDGVLLVSVEVAQLRRAHGGEIRAASSFQLGKGVAGLALSPRDLGCSQTHPPFPIRSLP